jgi:hypothetical protein
MPQVHQATVEDVQDAEAKRPEEQACLKPEESHKTKDQFT